MTALTEGVYPGEFLLGEDAAEYISRDTVTLTGGSYVAGQVLGLLSSSAVPTWQVSHAYSLGSLVQPATANGHFYQCKVAGTSGAAAPTWTTTGADVADGAGALIWTDKGTFSRYTAHDPAAGDGSQTALAILYGAVDASTADAPGVVIDRLAEVNGALLTWKSGISGGDKTAGIAALLTHNIVVR